MIATDDIKYPDENAVEALGLRLMDALGEHSHKHPVDADIVINAAVQVIYTIITNDPCAEHRACMVAACRHFFARKFTVDEDDVKHFLALMATADSPVQGNA